MESSKPTRRTNRKTTQEIKVEEVRDEQRRIALQGLAVDDLYLLREVLDTAAMSPTSESTMEVRGLASVVKNVLMSRLASEPSELKRIRRRRSTLLGG